MGDSEGEENETAMTTAPTTAHPAASASNCEQGGNGDRDDEDEDKDTEEGEGTDDTDTRTRMAGSYSPPPHLVWGGVFFSCVFNLYYHCLPSAFLHGRRDLFALALFVFN